MKLQSATLEHKRILRASLCLCVFYISSLSVAFGSTYYGATFDGTNWTAASSAGGTPGNISAPTAGSTFNTLTTGGNALTISGGATDLNYSGSSSVSTIINGDMSFSTGMSFSILGTGSVTNSITGNVNGDTNAYVFFSNQSTSNTSSITTTITGDVNTSSSSAILFTNESGSSGSTTTIINGSVSTANTTSGSSRILFYNVGSGALQTTINGPVTVNDTVDFSNQGTGTSATTITRNMTVNSGGYASFYNQLSGTAANSLSNLYVNGGNADFSNQGTGTLTNIITGNMTVSSGGSVDFSNSGSGTVANTITGGINVNGSNSHAYFYNGGSGTVTNTITGGVSVTNNGYASFQNNGTSTVINTISDGVSVASGGSVNFMNYYFGTTTNTITGGVTIDTGGKLILGGDGSTTTIDTLNWNAGTLQLVDVNGSFGSTYIGALSVNGPVTLELLDGSNAMGGGALSSYSGSTQTLFTAGTFTGDASQITLYNSSPFTEVIATSESSNGISVSPDGTVTVTTISTATTTELDASSAMDALTDAASTVQVIAAAVSDASFAFITKTPYERAAANARIARTMRTEMIQNRTDSFEALMHALSKEETPQVVKFKGDYRVFATPYITSTQNTVDGYANGYNQKYYGMMVGASHYFKKADLNMTLLFGVGATKVQMNSNVASRTTGKSFMTGIVLQKSFLPQFGITIKTYLSLTFNLKRVEFPVACDV